ncbi:hypothetical protein [Lysinibacter cavernae]|uniref:Uncharacterized protein n=1 Tax=Lysinibacter cavernae TaxID=1640652 RepID=A0A7X5QZQ0_9MICO|nr:hypothetical protein [Lysinibacter cavernae]NIH52954.1 hypothetical protein [Lysinibacter cavernae]
MTPPTLDGSAGAQTRGRADAQTGQASAQPTDHPSILQISGGLPVPRYLHTR